MSEDKNILSHFTPKKGDFVYSIDNKCIIVGFGTIDKNFNPTFELF